MTPKWRRLRAGTDAPAMISSRDLDLRLMKAGFERAATGAKRLELATQAWLPLGKAPRKTAREFADRLTDAVAKRNGAPMPRTGEDGSNTANTDLPAA